MDGQSCHSFSTVDPLMVHNPKFIANLKVCVVDYFMDKKRVDKIKIQDKLDHPGGP